jgi:alpha-N-arabinofuranosidase
LVEKDIRIAMDEWNFWYGDYIYGELGVRYFLKDALGVAIGLHEYFRNSEMYYMANYAQTVNVIGCIKTTRTDAAFATTGLVLKLYRQHVGSIPIEISGTPEPLDVTAALTEDKKYVTIGIVNPTEEKVKIPIKMANRSLNKAGKHWIITGKHAMVYNEPGKKPNVEIEENNFKFSDMFTVLPISVNLYKFELQ